MQRQLIMLTTVFLFFLFSGNYVIAQSGDLTDSTSETDFFIQPWIWSAVGIIVLIILLISLKGKRDFLESDQENEKKGEV